MNANNAPGRTRRLVGLLITMPIAAGLWFAPLPLAPDAQRLLAVFGGVIALWVSEAIPIGATAMLIAPLMVVAGITSAKTAFAPYADPLLFLFIGGFMIAEAMKRHGLDRRIANLLLRSPWVHGAPRRVRAAFMLTAMILSMWISNTATTAILVPILLGATAGNGNGTRSHGKERGGDGDDHAVTGSLLAIAYACSLGGTGTLIGSPPNLIAARFLNEHGFEFGFVRWMMIGVPTSLLLVIAAGAVLERWAPPHSATEAIASGRQTWTQGELVTALSFGLAVLGWSIPGILKAAEVPGGAELSKALPGGVVAVLAASVLFFFRDDSPNAEPVLPWRDAMRIDWGIILLFGGGISLGKQMFDTGLAASLSRGFVEFTGVQDLWALTAIVTVFTIFFTEVCSNTASSNMLVPLVIAIANELGVSPLPPTLAVGLAASCAFMLPIATAPNAIVYGTGRIKLPDMMRVGLVMNLVSAAVIFAALRVFSELYGWS